ncbi:TatD family hydrolase [Agromyces aerolatus]|uniref:TatD family hydrolase n=1 Tax=Agromyces sp. LY-1074 TaxID=3074080 RepID=UPI0028640F0B|nr:MULTISPECIES: TatD family hydrolase [unclassified Agromyces]MDR5698804.1 TatD family hydrolase [Agromyces sp. LY-1074]MDR5705418.1 TatD family hydrolase [Agromyces sp. LY-1358]
MTEHLRTRGDRDGKAVEYPPAPDPLPLPVFDNHTHLEIADSALPLSVAEHLDRAASVGVAGAVQVGTDVATSRWSAEVAAREPRLLAAVALHPNEAPVLDAAGRLDDALAVIDELAAQPRVRAVGETGLDTFRTGDDGRAAQFRSFEAHIDIAKRHGLALQIHDRDAHDDVVATLRRVGAPDRTVFHCFSGGEELAALAADEGWYCSFAGNVTFKNAENLREALRVVPRDRMLVETDAPYLTPAPLRGRPNAPYLVPHTVRFMAEVLGAPLDELCAELASNTVRVYGSWQDEAVDAERIDEGRGGA